VFYTLIETCRLNDVDPRAWLADVLIRVADHPAHHIAEMLPWNWKTLRQRPTQAQAA
jgi:transposase